MLFERIARVDLDFADRLAEFMVMQQTIQWLYTRRAMQEAIEEAIVRAWEEVGADARLLPQAA